MKNFYVPLFLGILAMAFFMTGQAQDSLQKDKFQQFVAQQKKFPVAEGGKYIPPVHVSQLKQAILGTANNQWKNQNAIEDVLMANVATDLVALKEDYGGFMLHILLGYFFSVKEFDKIYTHAQSMIPRVTELTSRASFCKKGTDGFHFDNLFSFDEVMKRWGELEKWAKDEVRKTQSDETYWEDQGREDFLIILGITTHMIQDFYAHSSWVNCVKDFYRKDIKAQRQYPIWEEIENHRLLLKRLKESNETLTSEDEYNNGTIGGLQTGSWNYLEQVYSKREQRFKLPWKHREPAGENERLAFELSTRSTKIWKDKIIGWLKEPYKKDLEDYVYNRYEKKLSLQKIVLGEKAFSRSYARIYFILKKHGKEIYNGLKEKKVYYCKFPGSYNLDEVFSIKLVTAAQYRLEIWHDSYFGDKLLETITVKDDGEECWNAGSSCSLYYEYK